MPEAQDRIKRRDLFAVVAGAAAALMGALATLVGAGFLYPQRRGSPRPLFVCLEEDIQAGAPLELQDLQGKKTLLLREPGGELLAISTVCSHLGCTVFYRPEQQVFECPCHQGVFDAQGDPVSGPPERPLRRYPTEVRDGKVFVRFS
jgi:cytochrome b6-f complex iron-sulfur subunit